MLIAASVMKSVYLHREIREKGGAYGGGAVERGGSIGFFSYYDPNTTQTLGAFRAACAWAADGGFEDRDVAEALLSTFGDVDSPVRASARGQGLFRGGLSRQLRQRRRDALLETTKDDLVQLANKYLVGAAPQQVVIGKKGGGATLDGFSTVSIGAAREEQ